MRASFALALVFAALSAMAVAPGRASSGGTSVRVTYWEDGAQTKPTATWTLRCSPPRGTLARPAVACKRLARGGPKLFAPLPRNIVCTEIYGGPQRARVVGTVAGKRVWATFGRQNGCHIDRWNRLAPWLLPPGGVS